MKKGKKLYEGKAKIIYATTDKDLVIQYFKDDATAFNNQKKTTIEGKGVLNNRISEHILSNLSQIGIKNHLVKRLNMREQVIKLVEIIPIEFIVRNVVTGSITKRLGIEDGLILDPPLFEFFLKDDDLGDPLITEHHIKSFRWASPSDIEAMSTLTLKVNDILVDFFNKANLILVDFKLEFGLYDGKILLADEFTPDGCRLWDKDTLTKMDKDRFRQDLGDVIETYGEVAERLGMQIKLD